MNLAASFHSPGRAWRPATLRDHLCAYAQMFCCTLGVLLLVGCNTPDDTVSTGAGAGYLYVEVVDDLVTVEAHNVPLQELLVAIALQSDIDLATQEALDEKVTVTFTEKPLPKALGALLRNHNFALQYVATAGESTLGKHSRLWVFASDDRAAAPDNLVQAADAAAVAPLSLALADADVEVRLDAVSALTRAGGEPAAEMLAAALSDEQPEIREAAVDALGRIGGATAIDALGRAIVDPQEDVREAAIGALVEIGGQASVQALAVALNDEDVSLREEAVDALGEIGGEAAMLVLQRALADEHSSVREIAGDVLAELTEQAE